MGCSKFQEQKESIPNRVGLFRFDLTKRADTCSIAIPKPNCIHKYVDPKWTENRLYM